MIINGISTSATHFVYDGSHRFYLIEDDVDKREAEELGYTIKPIKDIRSITEKRSGTLKIIHNWKLDKTFTIDAEQWQPYSH